MADLTITANEVKAVHKVEQFTLPLNGAFNIGDLGVVDPSTGKAVRSDADAAKAKGLRAGILISKQGAAGTFLEYGLVDPQGAVDSLNLMAPLYFSTNPGKISDTPIGANEQQTVDLDSPSAGTFTLTFDGQTTAAIAFNASAADVKSALEALAAIGAGNVDVTGNAGGPYTVTFSLELHGDVPLMTIDGGNLTDAGAEAVTSASAGVDTRRCGFVYPAWNDPDGNVDKIIYVNCLLDI